MADPYSLLGVPKSATAEDIKSAYRKLAKKLHPDVNPGRKDIEQKFKEVTSAYDLLSDKDKRARFDRGEIDEQGQEKGFGFGRGASGSDPFRGAYRQHSRSGAGFDPSSQFGDGEDFENIFAEFMGRGRGNGRRSQQRGGDASYSLRVSFVDACTGCKMRVTLNSGKTIDVSIPPASEEGQKLRLRGQGEEGLGGAGDAIIEIHVETHPYFTRKDQDILLEAPVSLSEAILGASITVPTLDGSVTLKVPKGSNSGSTLRLKGKGVPNVKGSSGDMMVKLKVVLPDAIPEDLHDAAEKLAKKHPYDPRKKLGW